jgi:hypothetical protein
MQLLLAGLMHHVMFTPHLGCCAQLQVGGVLSSKVLNHLQQQQATMQHETLGFKYLQGKLGG